MASFLALVRAIGRGTLRGVRAVGRAGMLAVDSVQALRKLNLWVPNLMAELSRIGVESVPIALFIATFTGMVLAIQAQYSFTGTVPEYFVGVLVGKTMILELGPVLTGLALAGRVGATIAAEIGTMRVTEQIDALETLAYDPVAYLVVPRVVAGAIMFPVVVALACAVGVGAGWLTGISLLEDLSSPEFIRGLRLFFQPWDVQFALIKAFTFGLTVTGVGCAFGYHTRGGAEGVGKATTRSVVVSSMIILVLDAFWAVVLLG